jgi:thymidylate synthase (FAD)
MEPIEFRQQAEKNRQSSEEIHINGYKYNVDIYEPMELLFGLYKEMVENGVSKETARMILPLATTTRLYMKGSVRSWIHYLQIRTGTDTQKEHREIAEKIKVLFNKYFPKTAEALNMDGND